MSAGTPGVTDAARDAVERGRKASLTFLSAAIAYYGIVSLVPLAAIAAIVVSFVAGDAVAERLLRSVGDSLSMSGREAVRRALTSAAGRTQATLVGGVALLWGASRLFRGLNHAFGEVYGTEDSSDLLGHFRDAVVTLGGVLLAAVVVLGLELLPFFDQLNGWVAGAIRVVLLAALLFPAYYVLPDVPVGLGESLPGALVAAVGWAVLYAVFDLYLSMTGGSSLGGAAGGAVVLITFLYFAAFVVLVGAVVNATLGGR